MAKQGTKRYNVAFPKYKKGGYMVKKVLVNATYGKAYRGLSCTLLKMNFLYRLHWEANDHNHMYRGHSVYLNRRYSKAVMCSVPTYTQSDSYTRT